MREIPRSGRTLVRSGDKLYARVIAKRRQVASVDRKSRLWKTHLGGTHGTDDPDLEAGHVPESRSAAAPAPRWSVSLADYLRHV
jgi:hypothetical protein